MPTIVINLRDRAAVIAKHRAWLAHQPRLRARLGELAGKRLASGVGPTPLPCAPTGGLPGSFEGTTCHGEILAALADEIPPQGREAQATHEAAPEAAHVGASGGSPRHPPTPPGDLTRRAALLGAVGLAVLGAGVTTATTLADPNNAASTQNPTGTPTCPTGPISTARGTEGQEQESPTATGNAGATPAPAPTEPTSTPTATPPDRRRHRLRRGSRAARRP